jgi:hypothetical protein
MPIAYPSPCPSRVPIRNRNSPDDPELYNRRDMVFIEDLPAHLDRDRHVGMYPALDVALDVVSPVLDDLGAGHLLFRPKSFSAARRSVRLLSLRMEDCLRAPSPLGRTCNGGGGSALVFMRPS